jgi:glycosyltransferase involved in cell wall biosynthesis
VIGSSPSAEPGPRRRLLIVGPPPDAPGGISTCVRSILHSDIAARFAIRRLSPTGEYGYRQPKALALLRLLRALLVCPFLMLFRRPAIVQVHTAYGIDFWRSASFVLMSRVARVPTVLIIHGSRFDRMYEDAGPLQRAAIRFVLRRPAAIHVRGEYWRHVLHAIVPGLPVHLLPTTTDPVEGLPVAQAAKWQEPIVLFVGGITAAKDNVRKGLPDLLAIVSRLIEKVPDAKVQVVGPTSGEPWQALLASDSSRRVEFMGSLTPEEIAGLYRAAAVFVLPSHAEGMPNAILEAMAHGLPVVSTTVGSIPEVVEHGAGGYLLPPGDADRLLGALVDVLRDPERALRMGEHNRAVVRDRFSNRQTTDRLLVVYEMLLRDQAGSR